MDICSENSIMSHKHICGAIASIEDEKGTVRRYKSLLLENINLESVPPKYMTNVEDKIEKIEYVLYGLGLFSSKYAHQDQLDTNFYQNEENELICSQIIGCCIINLYHPYNMITHHTKNRWMMYCLNIAFQIKHAIIPFNDINLPQIINIKRSSGKIQKAFINSDEGIIIKKSKTNNDLETQLYVKVNFDIDDKIQDINENSYLSHSKHINLDELFVLNPNIESCTIKFNTLQYSDYSDYSNYSDHSDHSIHSQYVETHNSENNEQIKSEVLNHFNNKFNTFIEDIVKPPISRLQFKNINLIY